MPVVTTLHTVLRDPDTMQRRVMKELVERSDRVVVMGDGRVKGTLPREALSQEKIMFLATEGM